MVMSRGSTPPAAVYGELFAGALGELPGRDHPRLREVRRANFAQFEAAGFPGPKVEAWKYTPLTALADQSFGLAPSTTLRPADVAPYLIDDPGAIRLVFVNGRLALDLSDPLPGLPGLSITSLRSLLEEGVEVEDLAPTDGAAPERGLSALNAALTSDGCVIEVAPGTRIEAPVQLVLVDVGQDTPAIANPRNSIRLGDGAGLHLIETHLALAGGLGLVNLLARITLGSGANLRHDRLQLGETRGRLLTHTTYSFSADARLTHTVATFGGDLVRNEIEAAIRGPRAEAALEGLYLARGRQHLDTSIRIEHDAPDSRSDQHYKGVLDDRARAVFAGCIMVRPDAQKTNAYQSNGNLLLSPDAEIDTKPELEIFADDVKCSHGATAGELDEHELFYLRSRGLDQAMARRLLTYAFASDVLERFASPAVAAQAERALMAWLGGGEAPGGVQ